MNITHPGVVEHDVTLINVFYATTHTRCGMWKILNKFLTDQSDRKTCFILTIKQTI